MLSNAALVIDSCPRLKDWVFPVIFFHSFVLRNHTCWEQLRPEEDEANTLGQGRINKVKTHTGKKKKGERAVGEKPNHIQLK